MTVNIRTYRPGDEEAQAAIYNEAAAGFPKFKPASAFEVRRRCQAPEFDAGAWFYAEEGSGIAGYATFQKNGRVSYPWCRPGLESLAEPLFRKVVQAMKDRGHKSAFAAYRGDWSTVNDFFKVHGFQGVREMVNFVLDLPDMPTPPARPASAITPLQRQDVPAILRLAPGVFHVNTVEELERHLFDNPYFGPEAVYVLRDRSGTEPLAVGVFIEDPAYADPKLVDPAMPCFRLGAFGTEGMATKRINGLFSFVARSDQPINPLGLDLVGHAAFRLQKSDLGTIAAQVASDAPALLRFYQSHFRRQGSFPVLVRQLDG